jgi:hypothetical protein
MPWRLAAVTTRAATVERARAAQGSAPAPAELDRLEARLLEADGCRVWAQQRARADLADCGEPLTRLNVARRACELLDDAELMAC